MNWALRRAIMAALKTKQGTLRSIGAAVNLDHTSLRLELEEMVKEHILTKTENDGWRERTGKRCRYSYALEDWHGEK